VRAGRGDGHDAPSVSQEADRGTCRRNDPAHVHGQLSVERRFVALGIVDQASDEDPCHIDEDVEPSEVRDDAIDRRGRLPGCRVIGLYGQPSASVAFDRVQGRLTALRRLGLRVANVSPLSREPGRNRRTDTARTSGHHRDLAYQPCAHGVSVHQHRFVTIDI
jgi:hypothetical protein